MRLIGTLNNERKAHLFSLFLKKIKIAHHIDREKNNDWGDPSYGQSLSHIWIEDENQVEEAAEWLSQFSDNPENPLFISPLSNTSLPAPDVPPTIVLSKPVISAWEKRPMGWITRGLIVFCTLLFFLSQLSIRSTSYPAQKSGLLLFTSPIEKTLLYDYPLFYERIERFISLYGIEELEHPSSLAPAGARLWQRINQTPMWPGYYQLLLKQGWKGVKTGLSQYPTFEKIRKGELWRLFTPIFLHGDLFHIFFNMLWLIVLGKQIELRLSPLRYCLFIALIAALSNTAQYFMSGSNFIGFSGVLCGMLAFIWVRQKNAAWEGYQVERMTLIFMLVFIVSMAMIQLSSFILEKSLDIAFSPNIANMAHLSGGVLGYIFGKINFFSWRHA